MFTDNHGFNYFNELPERFRVATETDFVNCPYDKPLLELSDDGLKYYCHRVKFPDVILQSIETSLNLNKIFVCK